MFCTHCGSPLTDGARFCTQCGTPVLPPSDESKPVSPVPPADPVAPVPPVPPEPAPAVPQEPVPPAAPQETSAPQAPPPPQAPTEGQRAPTPKKKRWVLPLCIAAAVVVLGAAVAGFLLVSNQRAFRASMADGQSYMDEGDYSAAVSSYEKALERKPKSADAVLALARAYLCAGRMDEAGELLTGLSLSEGDERLSDLERLTALAALDPSVRSVDTDAFPSVTLTLSRGSGLELTAEDFTIVEDDAQRQVTDVEQSGSTVRVTYLAEDTDVSQEPRELSLTLQVDHVTFRDSASYTTPYFEPAQLAVVSTDVSEYPTVKVYLRVSNAATGENVDGLGIHSFTLSERVQGGEYLAREIRSATPLKDNAGLHIDLVADKSDSISLSDMAKIQSVMTEFVSQLHYSVGDKAELLAFDSIVQQMCYYTDDVDLLTRGIYNMSTDGLTAFYDAVYSGVTNAALQGGARCVIAFTDGQDNRSRYTANQVIQYANEKQVPVYIIGVGSAVEASTLRSIAQNTGGRYWYIDDLYDLQEIFNQIYEEQKQLYVVEYDSDASLDSYLTRDLSVQVSGGGCRGSGEMTVTPVRSIYDNGGSSHTSRYQLVKECLSWEDASQRCQEMGGHLATITSQDEMDLLVSMAEDAGCKYLWLGGYTSYDNSGNVFGHWVTGEDFSYQAWAADEPSRVDQDGTEEWYIMLWNIPSLGGWTWNDQRNDPAAAVPSMVDEMAFICEFEE